VAQIPGQAVFAPDLEGAGQVVELLVLLEVAEVLGLHVGAPDADPVALGLREAEVGAGDGGADNVRRDRAHLPFEQLFERGWQLCH